MSTRLEQARAFAPATVGNIAVGFDLLGHALEGPGDRVTARRLPTPEVRIREVRGVVTDLPRDPKDNTATAGLVALIEERGLSHGFEIELDKGIAIGSGMGGSAASAAAGIVAAGALLDEPLTDAERFRLALIGEAVATGAAHGDNLAPCLFGGIQLVSALDPPRLQRVPAPPGVWCALAHPHQELETRRSRQVLREGFELDVVVAQSGRLAAFLAACFTGQVEALATCLEDVLIEPRRAPLIEGFEAVKAAALESDALGCSISGGGPSVFAWCRGPQAAGACAAAMVAAFEAQGVPADAITSPVDAPGARLEEQL